MNDRLPCGIIRDLLPSYVDGLTGPETNRAVEEHVRICRDCRETLERMRAPEGAAQTEDREIDFLRRVKRRQRRILLGSIVGVLCVVAGVIGVKLFLIGSGLSEGALACRAEVSGQTVTVTGSLTASGLEVSAVSFREDEGVVTVNVRGVLAGPFYSGQFQREYTAQEPVVQVRVGEKVLWDRGVTISPYVSAAYGTRHAYVGDAPANGETAAALGIAERLGGFTNQLQTGAAPYGWTIRLTEPVDPSREESAVSAMESYAPVLMALIGNLEQVRFEYIVEGVEKSGSLSLEEASAAAGGDVKALGETPSGLQELMERLDVGEK